ncbi:D-3-phosphoglycerate dehydrogenase [Brevibacterium sanguinis]|uniref:D-3-phosphoglycerate dehydrogenase n=2 Tax=Brevibacterium TaxID=1696 RepID=A0A366INZ4_9MICO|nr:MULTISPECIES: NAD(P)-dependent oxidoreductase [Brevibacterium]RBP67799.1 D-3-phosphoglycerate dehydrogenase [Brevibacterium sanguinis]RBP74784.1 D-3-phosphoglycerate dehydrogenase [Brevibacterium celere]
MPTKKFVIIGDKLLSSETISAAIAEHLADDWKITALTFGPDDLGELDSELGRMEAGGADAVCAPDEVLEEVRDAQVVLTHMCPINTAVFDAAPQLELVGVLRGGTENVLVDVASARGIPVLNTVGRTSEAVSDYTVGMMLSETRNIARSHHAVMSGRWEKDFSNSGSIPEFKDLTIGIIGFGEIGRLVQQKLSGFHCTVLVYDPFVGPSQVPEHVRLVSDLDSLLATADVVTIHARHEIGAPPILTADKLALLKPTSYLINSARAGLIDMESLTEALADRRIAGAALDVFEIEPIPPQSPLLELPNVTLSSHIAFDTAGFYTKSPVLWWEGLNNAVSTMSTRSLVNDQAVDLEKLRMLNLFDDSSRQTIRL